ncbi:Pentatricopeptide repeat-containing protein, mitochondrial [Zostera marina]|uniref:Pentatricopeptide repeat-containing protein, mitochondrial n=1 Tax=Zostera marina TaxID=29655 RepID=A0A0K9NWK3_ZOSMR|nr:Pentatricopeptide repeat-containing protein, mitochondrial [Zostera marina]
MAGAVRRWLSSSIINQWDPTTSLELKHPTLVLLEVCTNWDHFKQILAQTMRHHLITCTFPMSRLLYFSAISHPEFLTTAVVLFAYFTPKPNLYIHNIMISALSSSSFESTSEMYRSLLYSAISPDEHTFLPLMKSASCLSELTQVHAHIVITAHHSQLYIQNLLIKMYSGEGKLDMAYQVFDHMPLKDSVSFNTMISGYTKNRRYMRALEIFSTMKHTGNEPDPYTISSILLCCGYLHYLVDGKSAHAWIIRRNLLPKWGLILTNSLLEMYVKSQQMEIAATLFRRSDVKDVVSWNSMIVGFVNVGYLESARELFDKIPRRDIVSWNSLLSGYVQTGNTEEVIELFKSMLVDTIKPNNITFVTLITAFSDHGIVNQAMCVHGHILRTTANNPYCDAFVATALINMYSKCGSIHRSLEIWRESSGIRDIQMWTSIITGLALNGNSTQALKIFHQMQAQEGLIPNQVTLLAVLTACVHAGSIEEGRLIFNTMKETYGIEPGLEHYGCLVNLYTRAGRLSEAYEFIRGMPVEPTRSMWGAVLSCCKEQGNVELAIDASRQLLKMAPEEEVSYILLSGTYALGGRWGLSRDIRNVMDRKGLRKKAGWSSVNIKGIFYYFVATSDEKKNIEIDKIRRVLSDIDREMKYGIGVFCDL